MRFLSWCDRWVVGNAHGRETDVLASGDVEVVEGVTKAVLQKRGFHYVPAALCVQRDLWTHMLRANALAMRQLGFAPPAVLNGAQ